MAKSTAAGTRTSSSNPVELARACAYNHASRLIEALGDSQHPSEGRLGEHTYRELERVE